MSITVAEAALLQQAGYSLKEVIAQFGEIDLSGASAASVTAAAAAPKPEVPVNEALLAQVVALFDGGREAEPTKKGRPTRVYGAAEGIAPFSIVIYGPAV